MSIDSLGSSSRRSLPKYSVMRDVIAAQIYRGDLREGDQLPTVKELMRNHALSFATVTRALAELEKDNLIVKRWGLGTFVRAPRVATRNIAVTFDSRYSITHPRRVRLCRGLAEAAESNGLHLQMFPLVQSTIFDGEAELLLAKLIENGEISGLIGCSPHPPSDIRRLTSHGVPIVAINHEYPEAVVTHVGIDAEHAAGLVVNYLRELGHRRVGLVLGVAPDRAARPIRSSQRFATALLDRLHKEQAMKVGDHVVFSNYDWHHTEPKLRQWFDAPDRPTALFCLEEHLAMHTIELATRLGLRVPEDLSVMGMGWLAKDGITTLRTPDMQKGAYAIEALSAAFEGKHAQHQMFQCALEVNNSTGPPPRSA